MSYLAPSEFVTKMVDAGESKIFMSTRDTLIRAYMAGAILCLAAAFAVMVTQQTGYPDHRRHPVPGRLLHALPARLRPGDGRVRARAARAVRQAPGRDARRRAAQLGPGVLRQFRRRIHGRGADGDRLHVRLHAGAERGRQDDRAHRRSAHHRLQGTRRGGHAHAVHPRHAVQLDGVDRRGRRHDLDLGQRQGDRDVDADHGVLRA